MAATAVLAGSTGLVGSHILTGLLQQPEFAAVYAYSRRTLPAEAAKLTSIQSADSADWPSRFPSTAGAGRAVFFSGLATTRAQAGGYEAQRKIEVELNLALARAAKDAGVDIYVLISSAGADSASSFGYPRIKGDIEDGVRALGFTHTLILRPGLIVGRRQDSRPTEYLLRQTATLAGRLGAGLKDFWAQDAQVIANAAIAAALHCLGGKKEPGVWLLGQADIVRLGRTEWVGPKS